MWGLGRGRGGGGGWESTVIGTTWITALMELTSTHTHTHTHSHTPHICRPQSLMYLCVSATRFRRCRKCEQHRQLHSHAPYTRKHDIAHDQTSAERRHTLVSLTPASTCLKTGTRQQGRNTKCVIGAR